MEVKTEADQTSGSNIFRRPRIPQKRARASTVRYTPLSGIRLLAEKGLLILTEEWEMTNQYHPEFRERRWKVLVYDGRDKRANKIVGKGEGPRKNLAKESAAFDFILKLLLQEPNLTLPMLKVSTFCRISPFVLTALEILCKRMGCRGPIYDFKTVFVRGVDKYEFSVKVGRQTFKEIAYELKDAKYGAAKKAYDSLSETEFTLDDIIMGSDCLEEHEREDAFRGSEELHIVHSKNPVIQLGRMFTSEIPSMDTSRCSSPVSWYEGKGGNGRCPSSSSCSSIMSPARKRMKVCYRVAGIPESSVLEKIRKQMLARKNAAL